MSSLPLISHRLFVAAIGNEGSAPEKPAANQPSCSIPQGGTTDIPLEVLDATKPLPSGATRPLRASAAVAGTSTGCA